MSPIGAELPATTLAVWQRTMSPKGLAISMAGTHNSGMRKRLSKTWFGAPKTPKLGKSWYLVAHYPDGKKEQLLGFETEADAWAWMRSDASAKWVKERGY